MKPRDLLITAATVAALSVASVAGAQEFPTKAVTLVSGYSPGLTASDQLARLFALLMQEKLGQPVLVESKVGATGLIAEDFVARSPPDGYTLLAGTSAITVNAGLRRSYNSHKTLKPVSVIASSPVFVYVKADSPYETIADLIAKAKAEPGKLSFATTGIGGTAHLATELFMSSTGTKMEHIPYKGASEVLLALLAGDVDVRVGTVLRSDNRVRALLVLDQKRMSLAPDVPSVTDAGISGFFDTFVGTVFMAPVDTPEPVMHKLYQALVDVSKAPGIDKKVEETGSQLVLMSPKDSAVAMQTGITGWTEVIDRLGIKMD